MLSTNEKLCLECNKPIQFGRRDKKFCSQECKSSFHNKNNQIKYKQKIYHEKMVYQNYQIIKSFYKEGKTVIRKSSFDEMGFNYNYFTTIFKSSKNIYLFIFDIGYTPIKENGIKKLLIVTYQDYMKKYSFDAWKNIK
ncbi:DUF2116 family Zn-ribbon domain-containing protein [Flammeovirga sp. SJP92]|uniref:DUF2116 family Zn-ribbon domain-containing protein n=1 Tax=Flammeovirga sp. SJP92 TaxID=1775430 RepID=UPI0007869350|nr:DUF2116 family Zn-ribbon domain-containing protein [Flammeovirga sp. SJP92]KXX70959.1 hypothetical protein AVL50_10140 [Flammeovirga sp. SJP92]